MSISTLPLGRALERSVSIEDLPDELLLMIIHGISIPIFGTSTTSLDALSRTNRRFHRLTTPTLYERFHNSCLHSYLFLRAITSNPRLAALVKVVDYHEEAQGFHWPPISSERKYTPTTLDKAAVEEGFQKVGLPDWEYLAEECNDEEPDSAMLCYALALQTRNVSTLTIDCRSFRAIPTRMSNLWLATIDRATTLPRTPELHAFDQLKDLELSIGPMPPEQLVPLFRMPQLEYLSLIRWQTQLYDEEVDVTNLRQLMDPGCNKLACLYLPESFVPSDILQPFFASATSLKSLDYEMRAGGVRFDDKFDEVVDAMDFGGAIECLKSNLDTLHLMKDWEAEDFFTLHIRGGLQDFKMLRVLTCSLRMLIPPRDNKTCLASLLPPALEKFSTKITCESEDRGRPEALRRLATTYPEYTPHLKSVFLEIETEGSTRFESFWAKLDAAFETTDVHFGYEILDEDAIESREHQSDTEGEWEHASDESSDDEDA